MEKRTQEETTPVIDPDRDLLDRLVRVMGKGTLHRLADRLEEIANETGHGQVVLWMHDGRVKQLGSMKTEREK
jgi:hypothetical protein